jgi:DNA-directed RNA polymerase subunit RPC12/RpoP
VSQKTEPLVLLLDIETMPDLKEVMKVIPSLGDYPGLTLKATINSVICFGYKIWGEKETRCLNAWDYPAWKKDVNDDKALCEDIHKIMSEADCFVSHNGKRFDLKFLQTRFIKHGLPPLPRTSHIDTCMEAKKNLLAFNNRLGTLAKFIKSEDKLENGGWELWSKVMNRDKKSMLLMEKYCKQDVIVLEAVFKKLLPFVNSMPNFNLFSSGEKDVCPNCGSTRLTGNGQRVTKEAVYMRVRCADCGTNSQKRKPEKEPRTF